MKKCETILVAVDFSDSSDNAFQMALSMARKFEAKLVVLHVINEPVDLRGFYVPHISFEKLEEEIEEGAKKMMESFCRQNMISFEDYECLIVPGLPYEQIIDQASEKSADLIVLGTHGRTGLDHVLFGSTAEKVVRKSPYPVLTVRLEEDVS
jgi:nucleotide-binding universal stress UspA family protein